MKDVLSVMSGVLFCIGFIPYALAILGRNIKFQKIKAAEPSKASWIIWVSLDTITLAGMYAKRTVNGQILGAVIGGWAILLLALKYGTAGWKPLDKYCLAGAVIGIVLWQMSGEANFGIIVSNLVMVLGSFPTFTSAWKDPSHEDKLAWTIFWISCVCALFAVPQWTIADAAQPVAFFIVQSVMMYILHIRHSRPVAA